MIEQWGLWIADRGTNFDDTPGWATDDFDAILVYSTEDMAAEAALELEDEWGVTFEARRMN